MMFFMNNPSLAIGPPRVDISERIKTNNNQTPKKNPKQTNEKTTRTKKMGG